MSEKLIFADDKKEQKEIKEYWKILIIDDEEDIHSVTKFALDDYIFEDKKLKFISAYSAKDAKNVLRKEGDIAMTFLDIVMESDDAGLKLIKYIREELENKLLRIILRTGQPGSAPEDEIVLKYDINDYKAKTELTDKKLFTVVTTALRSYQDLIKILEQEKLLRKQAKFVAMAEMIDAIAHQWKQPLTIMSLHASSIPLKFDDGEFSEQDANEVSDDILLQIQHLDETLEEFRRFFRPNKRKKKFYIKEVVDSVLVLLKDELQLNHIEIEIMENDESLIYGFPNELKHVILNIVNNARDNFKEKKIKNRKIILSVDKNNFSILDNGGGIDEDILPNIFNSNFTTKAKSKGSGVGLYLSKMIIEDSMDGKIIAKNFKQGIKFKITLPIYSNV